MTDADAAVRIFRFYRLRWAVEDTFKFVKNAFGIEEVQMLKLKAGIDLVHVPYRGGAQAATDAISGQIEMVSMGLASARVAEGGQSAFVLYRPLATLNE